MANELTPVNEAPSSSEKDLSVVKRFHNLTFNSPHVSHKNAVSSDKKARVTPLIGLIDDLHLISS